MHKNTDHLFRKGHFYYTHLPETEKIFTTTITYDRRVKKNINDFSAIFRITFRRYQYFII